MELVPNQTWTIVTFKSPVQWARTPEEVWYLNPQRRYVLNANQLDHLKPFIATASELKGSKFHRPLDSGARLNNAKILVERYRDRGIGDTLFMAGVLQYLADMSSNTATIDIYALANRADALVNHPGLKYGPLHGPVHYDDLQQYDYHWFVDHATEHSEEPDQPNVYDSLYRQLGIDPADVEPRYKRPVLRFSQDDLRNLNQVYESLFRRYNIDLRRTSYYAVSPTAVSPLRSLAYSTWMDIITELARRRPVVVVGLTHGQLPTMDISFAQFFSQVEELAKRNPGRVINMMGDKTPFRQVAGVIGRTTAFVSLDSGLLYAAQALRAPTVSLWGTHSPATRLVYDPAYMQLAIHKVSACPATPCYAFRAWPRERCPAGEGQHVCAPLAAITVSDVMEKVTLAEKLLAG